MPDAGYLAAAVVLAVAITFGLRALPFGARAALRGSPLLSNLGRWMPLGAMVILLAYLLSTIPFAGPGRGVPQLVGVAVTVVVHRWRRHAVLSILTGTAACLVLANGLLG